MTTHEKPVISSGAGLGSVIAVESGTELGGAPEIKARGYWELVWLRFKRDKIAIAGAVFVVLLVIVSFAGGPIATHFLHHGPNDANPAAGNNPNTYLPVGFWSHVTDPFTGKQQLFMFGADSAAGHDEFLRVLYGGQVSLEVGVGATVFSIVIGILMGAIAGYFGGWIDTLISRITEITMAFPYFLFVIALASTVGSRVDNITFGFLGRGVITLVLVLGLFGWFYSARVFRAVVFSLREKEFIEAARMVGSSDWKIIRSHVLPHLIGPLIVFSTLTVAQYILAEAALSYLGLGIKLPTASWGNLLSTSTDYIRQEPLLMIYPGAAVLLATLAFNLMGDGLRDAFDPRSTR